MLVVIGLAASVTLDVAPEAIIAGLPIDRSPIRMATDMVAGRSAAQAIVPAIAVLRAGRVIPFGSASRDGSS